MEDGELRQALSALESYNRQLETMNGQTRILQMSYEETMRARDTIKALSEAKEGDEVLVPVGASSFVPVIVSSNRESIVGVGSRVSVSKDFETAVAFMEKTMSELAEAIKKATAALSELEKTVTDLSAAIDNEYRLRRENIQ